jgi:aminoglycoside phosphotransferase (APT) family kinase protein
MVRSLKFKDNSRWIVRVRIPPAQLNNTAKNKNAAYVMISNEVHCIQLVRERTSVPVPEVFEFATNQSLLGSPFMLMGDVQGVVAMDLNFSFIPNEHKHHFY